MWITDKRVEFSNSRIYVFKKSFTALDCDKCSVDISAECRYKLYVNGRLVSHGPAKAAENEKYYDTLDISPYLVSGENELLVRVLQLPADDMVNIAQPIYALFRSGNMLLWCRITLTGNSGQRVINTDEGWLCRPENGITLNRPVQGVSASLSETVDTLVPCAEFLPAAIVMPARGDFSEKISFGCTDRFYLRKREIPHLFLKNGNFASERDGVYDAGCLKFGYIRAKFSGRGRVRLTYAECYGHPGNKSDRCDPALGLYGDTDEISVSGEYEFLPFWYRCFRFVKCELIGDVRLKSIDFIETGYPFEFEKDYDFGSAEDNALWDISLRTLKLCAHETYEDCPFYEQLQYQMDTSLQMLFTYCLTDDDALARQAIRAYAASQRGDGLMTSRYPALEIQYIPTFSLFFIFMLHCHLVRFGNKDFVKEYLDCAEGVLKWFEKRENENGLITRTHFWNFIDWADGWGPTAGAPVPDDSSPIAHHNLMVAWASRLLAEVYEALGRSERARDLNKKADRLCQSAKRAFFADGIFYDDEKRTRKSEHAQVWAVLSGAIDPDTGRAALEAARTWETRSTFAFAYFLFRAYEKCGIYEYSRDMMDALRALPKMNCTTVPETPHHPRSECHAWGSIAIYEFTHTLLGVKADSRLPYITVDPRIEPGKCAKGFAFTHFGKLFIRVENVNGLKIFVTAPGNVHFRFPEGSEYEITAE